MSLAHADYPRHLGGHVAAEEEPVEIGVVEQLRCGPVECQAPHLEHERAVRILERRAHVLLDHQHRRAGVGERAQQRHHVLDELGRQADGGLVDQQHARPQEQRAADFELLLLAAGQGRCLVVDPFADSRKALERLLDAARELPARQRNSSELEIVADRERAEEVAALRHEGDAVREELARRPAVDAFSFEPDLARARHEDSEQRLQHRRLARAVRSDQQRDLALPRIERRLVQYREARRIPGDDLVEFDDRVRHRQLPR
jgi:hypothetical protein